MSKKTIVGSGTEDGDARRVVLTIPLTVKELANKLQAKDTDVIKALFTMGQMRTVNQIVELEYAKDTAKKLGFEVVDTES